MFSHSNFHFVAPLSPLLAWQSGNLFLAFAIWSNYGETLFFAELEDALRRTPYEQKKLLKDCNIFHYIKLFPPFQILV